MAIKNNKARVITLRANKANLYNAVADRDQNILGKKIADIAVVTVSTSATNL
jgi:hypothetical protein